MRIRLRTGLEPAAAHAMTRAMRADRETTLIELLQNARRAGARNVEIGATGESLEIQDDGSGIVEPTALIEAGRSVWETDWSNELPSGIGLFVLAGYTWTVRSSRADPGGGRGEVIQARVEPGHLMGREVAEAACRADQEDGKAGTLIRIYGFDTSDLYKLVTKVATYMPLDVRVNGQAVRKQAFIDERETVRIAAEGNVSIGIRQAQETGEPSLFSFHGTVSELPIKPGRQKPSARIVAQDVRGLGLTRPGVPTVAVGGREPPARRAGQGADSGGRDDDLTEPGTTGRRWIDSRTPDTPRGGRSRMQQPEGRNWPVCAASAKTRRWSVAAVCLAVAVLSGDETTSQERWRGIVVAPEVRCTEYDSDDYRYPQSVELEVIERQQGLYSPYTNEWFRSRRESDIEHVGRAPRRTTADSAPGTGKRAPGSPRRSRT